jgi:hypothetical protein
MSDRSNDILDIAKIGLIAYLGYKVVNAIEGFGGGGKGDAEGASHTSQAFDCENFDYSKASFLAQTYEQLADRLEADFYPDALGGWTENDHDIGNVLMQMQKNEDVAALICAYNVRGRGYIIREYYNLPQAVARYLDEDVKAAVNADYQRKGLNFRW